MTSEAWKSFTKGDVREDGYYDAKCKFCGVVYKMGKSRGTGSLLHHVESGCKKMPRSKRVKPDALQRLLQAGKTGTSI